MITGFIEDSINPQQVGLYETIALVKKIICIKRSKILKTNLFGNKWQRANIPFQN